jgi:hypothetical protein
MQSEALGQEIPDSALLVDPGRLAAGTTLQVVPVQSSVNAPPPAEPTAMQKSEVGHETLVSVAAVLGVVATLQEVPSHVSMSCVLVVFSQPTAVHCDELGHETPVSALCVPGLGLATKERPPAVNCSVSVLYPRFCNGCC